MSQITIEIPEEALEALRLSPENAGATLRLAAAAKHLPPMPPMSLSQSARRGEPTGQVPSDKLTVVVRS